MKVDHGNVVALLIFFIFPLTSHIYLGHYGLNGANPGNSKVHVHYDGHINLSVCCCTK